MFRRFAAFAILACGFAATLSPARADDAASVGPLTIKQAWLRATPNGAKVAGGYITVVNAGPAEDTLTAASLDGASKGEVHTMTVQDGIMHMARLEAGLPVAPGATVTLKPGGDHLMFFDRAAPLKEGDRVSGTLTFAKAGTVKVVFAVAGLAARAAPGSK